MKIFKHILPVLLALLPACQRQEADSTLVEMTLYASTPGEDAPEARTVLDVINDRKILWSPGEYISIFAQGGNYQFRGNNTETTATASFTGLGPSGLDEYIALYPYNESAVFDGTYVSTTLNASQTGKPGSFADGCLITADDATGGSISFNHICSGIRFAVNRNDIRSVSIRGNNGEKIAGDFRFRFTAADTPVAEPGTEETVTLTAPGGHFETGKYYYIVVLPTVFTRGFTLSADVGGQVGEFRTNASVTFSVGAFKNVTGYLDERMTWTVPKVYYGPQNSFCLRPGGSVSFDVSPRLIADGWQRSGVLVSADVPTGADILWGTSLAAAVLSNGTLTITAAGSTGSSLVAIWKDDTILWSYLVWVTGNPPAETALPSGAVALPALGGECYFQWGRQDPLLPGCPVLAHPGDAEALSTSIRNPAAFIDQGRDGGDWYAAGYTHQDATLWGGASGSKTVWDPCPEGWRVPNEADFNGLDEDATEDLWGFEKLGVLIPDGNTALQNEDFDWDAWCWTREPGGSGGRSLRMQTDRYAFWGFSANGNARYEGLSVRCVKE